MIKEQRFGHGSATNANTFTFFHFTTYVIRGWVTLTLIRVGVKMTPNLPVLTLCVCMSLACGWTLSPPVRAHMGSLCDRPEHRTGVGEAGSVGGLIMVLRGPSPCPGTACPSDPNVLPFTGLRRCHSVKDLAMGRSSQVSWPSPLITKVLTREGGGSGSG